MTTNLIMARDRLRSLVELLSVSGAQPEVSNPAHRPSLLRSGTSVRPGAVPRKRDSVPAPTGRPKTSSLSSGVVPRSVLLGPQRPPAHANSNSQDRTSRRSAAVRVPPPPPLEKNDTKKNLKNVDGKLADLILTEIVDR
ncbi:spastin-like, partial [Etheostoma cragini]|uniref:spastin-like n=1 Tax=Etheostoma cragini TaxID=417921 RepID=UPI00155DE378